MAPSATPGQGGCAPSDPATFVGGAGSADTSRAAALFGALYSELHRLAQSQLARGLGPVTLGTTTLLHEAYLAMAKRSEAVFPDRVRFMGYAAQVMRRLIIDYVRSRRAQKRGGQFQLAPLGEEVPAEPDAGPDLVRLGDAIDELSALDAELAQVVDLKFFCGFSFAEIAAMRGVSERTVQRQWEKARIYLHRSLGNDAAVS